MKPIDTHAHLIKTMDYGKPLGKNIKENLKELEYIVNIGVDLDSSKEILELNKKYERLLPVIGIHPTDSNYLVIEDAIKELESMITDKVIALGETGLDYHWEHVIDNQKKSFIAHIELAKKYQLPIVIHSRDSHDDVYEIVKNYPEVKFLLHSWGGSIELTNKFLEMPNIWFSFSGVLTFKNAQDIRDLLKQIPKEKVLFETDSPFLTPAPFRGKTNFPKYVNYAVETASNLYNISKEEMINISWQSFKDFFKINES